MQLTASTRKALRSRSGGKPFAMRGAADPATPPVPPAMGSDQDRGDDADDVEASPQLQLARTQLLPPELPSEDDDEEVETGGASTARQLFAGGQAAMQDGEDAKGEEEEGEEGKNEGGRAAGNGALPSLSTATADVPGSPALPRLSAASAALLAGTGTPGMVGGEYPPRLRLGGVAGDENCRRAAEAAVADLAGDFIAGGDSLDSTANTSGTGGARGSAMDAAPRDDASLEELGPYAEEDADMGPVGNHEGFTDDTADWPLGQGGGGGEGEDGESDGGVWAASGARDGAAAPVPDSAGSGSSGSGGVSSALAGGSASARALSSRAGGHARVPPSPALPTARRLGNSGNGVVVQQPLGSVVVLQQVSVRPSTAEALGSAWAVSPVRRSLRVVQGHGGGQERMQDGEEGRREDGEAGDEEEEEVENFPVARLFRPARLEDVDYAFLPNRAVAGMHAGVIAPAGTSALTRSAARAINGGSERRNKRQEQQLQQQRRMCATARKAGAGIAAAGTPRARTRPGGLLL